MTKLERLLDANINRSSEGLRLLEDIARFELESPQISFELKSIRHGIRAIGKGWIDISRDRNTEDDCGIGLDTEDNFERPNLTSLVSANSSRVCEAFRVIEEIARVVKNTRVAKEVSAWRYCVYQIEKKIIDRIENKNTQWFFCLLLTRSMCKKSWKEVAESALSLNIDAIQIREPSIKTNQLVEMVKEIVLMRGEGKTKIIVNDRVDVALASCADGVHLGASDLTVQDAKKISKNKLIVGATAHTIQEARVAIDMGADYLGIGPIYQSVTKPNLGPCKKDFINSFLGEYPGVPHLAIGGISLNKMSEVFEMGIRGVAVSSAVCCSENPKEDIMFFLNFKKQKKHLLKK